MFTIQENQMKWEEYQLELVRIEVEIKKAQLEEMKPKRVISQQEKIHSPWVDLEKLSGYGGYRSDPRGLVPQFFL